MPIRNGSANSIRLALALACALPASAAARRADSSGSAIWNLGLEELTRIVVASKKRETLLEAPGTVYVITDKDIERYGWKDMREVLWAIPNIDMYWNWNGANGGQRGFTGNSSGTLLLLDGREAQNLVADEALMQNFPVHRIKRVEVLQGPGSAVHGSNANEGVINIVTKVADPGQRDTSLASLQAGTAEMKGAYALMRRNSGGVSMGVSTSYFTTRNDYPALREFVTDDDRYSRRPAIDTLRDHDGSKAYYPLENQTFDFHASGEHLYLGSNYYREQNLTGIERVRARFGERQNDRFVFLGYGGAKLERRRLRGFLEYAYMREDLNSLGGTAVAPAPNRVYRPERHRVKGEGSYDWGIPSLLVGYDGWILNAELLESANPGGLQYPFTPFTTFSAYTSGIFGDLTVALLDRQVRLSLGARVDKRKDLDPIVAPRAGIVYQPDAKTSIKFLYGKGTRAPNAWEVNAAVKAGLPESFPPRQTNDLEFNYVQMAGRGRWSFSNNFSAYRIASTDNFNQVLQGATYHLQFTPDHTIVGVEDMLRLSYGNHGGFLGGRRIVPTETKVGSRSIVADVPIMRGKLGAYAQPLPWLMAALFLDASGEVLTDATYPDGKPGDVLRIPGWVNTNLNFRLGDFAFDGIAASLALGIENVFDEEYYHPNHRGASPIQYLQTPRNFRVTLDIKM